MPTENRSSNTEMVSVPREQLRQFIEYSASICKSPAWVKDKAALLAAIDQPAQQHQVKPVAYRWKHLDGNGYMYGEELPTVILGAWQELYTHPAPADAGEVERLVSANTEYARRHLEHQAEVERLRLELKNCTQAFHVLKAGNESHTAQLAERDALLEEAYQHDIGTPLKRKMRALSASAEPSAHSNSQEILDGSATPVESKS